MSKTAVTLTILVALTVTAMATANPAKPKPWMWTTTQAVVALERDNPVPWRELGTIDVTRCAGKGKPVARHYRAFACSVTFKPQRLSDDGFTATLFVKVRANGHGQPCVSTRSVATVPKGCLNPKGVRISIDRVKAGGIVGAKVDAPATCLGYGAGYFECAFGIGDLDEPTAGKAILVMRTRPAVTVVAQPQDA